MTTVVKSLRWTGAVILLLVAALLIGASLVARFAKNELLNTDAYVASVAPLASDPAVQAAIEDRVTTVAVEKLDVPALLQEVAGKINIPGADQLINLAAPAVTQWVNQQIRNVVNGVVTSDAFPQVWEQLNRSAHQQIDNLLTGTDTRYVSTQGADIVVNLGPVLDAVKTALVARGLTLASKIPEVNIPYTVGHVEKLPQIQTSVHRFSLLATWLPILALVLLGLAVWLAPQHRRGLLIGLIMVFVVLVVLLVAYRYGRTQVTNRAASPAAGAAVYNSVLGLLRTALQTVAVVALLGIVWVLLAGPSRPATGFRRGVNAVLGKIGDAIGPQEPLRRFVTRFHTLILLVLAFLMIWWLLSSPSVGTAVLVAFVAALLTAAITLVVRLPRGDSQMAQTE